MPIARWCWPLAAVLLAGCASMPGATCAPDAQAAVQETLYMGLDKPKGGAVSEAEWAQFMDEVVTPRFPEGLTVLRAEGQWRGNDGKVVKEPSRMIFLNHGGDARAEAAVVEIANAYKARFEQEAVLRVRGPACMKFH